jgi:hypothetical protein
LISNVSNISSKRGTFCELNSSLDAKLSPFVSISENGVPDLDADPEPVGPDGVPDPELVGLDGVPDLDADPEPVGPDGVPDPELVGLDGVPDPELVGLDGVPDPELVGPDGVSVSTILSRKM